jgi:hypothetical protein
LKAGFAGFVPGLDHASFAPSENDVGCGFGFFWISTGCSLRHESENSKTKAAAADDPVLLNVMAMLLPDNRTISCYFYSVNKL